MNILAGNVKISTTKSGRRFALRWDMRCGRWFPMPLAQAELILATEGV